jgi:hypothetical protein
MPPEESLPRHLASHFSGNQRNRGILIQMFWRDHAPPHFHALYAEFEAQIDIRTLGVIEGHLPKRALALVLEWASDHRSELMEDWELCARMQPPKKIAPLS